MEMDAGIRDVAWNGEAGLTTRPVVRAIVEIMIGRRFNVDCRVPQRCSAAPIPQRHPRRVRIGNAPRNPRHPAATLGCSLFLLSSN